MSGNRRQVFGQLLFADNHVALDVAFDQAECPKSLDKAGQIGDNCCRSGVRSASVGFRLTGVSEKLNKRVS